MTQEKLTKKLGLARVEYEAAKKTDDEINSQLRELRKTSQKLYEASSNTHELRNKKCSVYCQAKDDLIKFIEGSL